MPYYKKAAELGHISGAANYAWILSKLDPNEEQEADIHTWSRSRLKRETSMPW